MTSEQDNAVDIARLETKLDALISQASKIETQTTITNGRVTSLEAWRNKALGAWFIVSFFGPIITGLVIGLLLGH